MKLYFSALVIITCVIYTSGNPQCTDNNNGDELFIRCSNCTCDNGIWNCEEIPECNLCGAVGKQTGTCGGFTQNPLTCQSDYYCSYAHNNPSIADQSGVCCHTCNLPVVQGSCETYIPKYYYNTTEGQCMTFEYSGCGGNENRFDTKQECLTMCVCNQPKIEDACDDNNNKNYYYDSSLERCKKFTNGKCGLNSNRFTTKNDCKLKCINP